MSHLAKVIVLRTFPKCEQAWFVGDCPICGRNCLIWWSAEKRVAVDKDGYLEGGVLCNCCGYSNAGKVHHDLLLLNKGHK